jgi:hypothetical protein
VAKPKKALSRKAKGKLKQSSLPGVERRGGADLEHKGGVLADVRAKRMKMQGEEADAQFVLLEAMKKANVTAFDLEDGRTVSIREGAEKVSIRTPKEEKAEADEVEVADSVEA